MTMGGEDEVTEDACNKPEQSKAAVTELLETVANAECLSVGSICSSLSADIECPKRRMILDRFAQLLAVLVVCGSGLYLAISGWLYWNAFSSKENNCETSTSEWESYYKIELHEKIEKKYPLYTLYLAGELFTEELYRTRNFSRDSNEYLDGVPILFIPGNRGFHEQGRTISSILTHMLQHRGYSQQFHFDYFTIDFNEESLALSGHYLFKARAFVDACMTRIKNFYARPKNVLLIGHSVGGIIGRSLLSSSSISNTLITVATPHLLPVVYTDALMEKFYDFFLKNAPPKNRFIISFAPGRRDFLVPAHLTRLRSLKRTAGSSADSNVRELSFEAIPKAHQSADHVASSYCNSASIVISRMIFDWVDRDKSEFSQLDWRLKEMFVFHFVRNPGAKSVANESSMWVPNGADSHCKPVGEDSRTFVYLSRASDQFYLCVRSEKREAENERDDESVKCIGHLFFSALPPFEKTAYDEHKNIQRLVPGFKWALLDSGWLRKRKYSHVCVPRVTTLSREQDKGSSLDVMYAFNADEQSSLTLSNGGTFLTSRDVMYSRVDVAGGELENSFHVLDVTVESSCSVAFLIYEGEDGNVPHGLHRGKNTIRVVSWLPFKKASFLVIKTIGCEVSLKVSASFHLGLVHQLRSQVTAIPTCVVILALLIVRANFASEFKLCSMVASCFKPNFTLSLSCMLAACSTAIYFLNLLTPDSRVLYLLIGTDLKVALEESLIRPIDPLVLLIPAWIFCAALAVAINALLFLLTICCSFQKAATALEAAFCARGIIAQLIVFTGLLFKLPSCAVVLSIAAFVLFNVHSTLNRWAFSFNNFCRVLRRMIIRRDLMSCCCLRPTKLSAGVVRNEAKAKEKEKDACAECVFTVCKHEDASSAALFYSRDMMCLHQLGLLVSTLFALPNFLFFFAVLKDARPAYFNSDPTLVTAVPIVLIYFAHLSVRFVLVGKLKLRFLSEYSASLTARIFCNVTFWATMLLCFVGCLYRFHRAISLMSGLYLMLCTHYVLKLLAKVSKLDKKCE